MDRVKAEVTHNLLQQAGDLVNRAYDTGQAGSDPIIPDLENRLGDVAHLLTDIRNDIWKVL